MALNFPAIGLVIGVIWLSIEYLAADYFMELMNQYQIAPSDIHRMFLDSMHRYLAWASTVAVLLAVLVSYVLSNRVLRPLKEVSHAIHKMSSGDRDVRARTLSNDELGELAEAFNLMAELRTPVTNIRGYVEGLRDGVIAPDNHNLSILEKESLRLGDLVESLLDLSRADAAKFSLNIQKLNIQDSISIAIDRNTEIIKKKNLNIIVHVSDEAHMSNQSETIKSEDLPLIFERFYRSEKSRSRNSGGAGIGLAIVKKLVDAHGGTVGASSSGDLFTVWFSIPDRLLPEKLLLEQTNA